MKKKLIIFVSILFLLLFIVVLSFIYNYYSSVNNLKVLVTLNRCVDGDTVWLNVNNEVKKFRLLGIDTPEVDQEYGNDASIYVCDMLSRAKKIYIEYDKVGKRVDKYNRELVWIFVDGKLLQSMILNEGLASVKYIYANYMYLDSLYKSESNAKNKRIGIWNDYSFIEYDKLYTVQFDDGNSIKNINVIKNNTVDLIYNPYKNGCTFIGWKNGNYLFDLSTKINKDYKLEASFEC